MDIQTEKGLKEAFAFLEAGNPEEASKIIQNCFLYDSVSPELVFTSDCCNRWIDFIRKVISLEAPMERGEALLAEWKNFLCHTRALEYVSAGCLRNLQGSFFPGTAEFQQADERKGSRY